MADGRLIRGTLDLLILKVLADGPLNGFEITSQLEQRSRGALDVEDSALYQALHRMESRGLVDADWGISENNRRARYYRLTRDGKGHLRDEGGRWVDAARVVLDILGARANA